MEKSEVNVSTAVALVLTFATGMLSGLAFGGPPGAVVGAFLGASSGLLVVYRLSRARRHRALDSIEFPAAIGLDPHDAIGVLSAAVSDAESPPLDFRSQVLLQLEEVGRYAEEDPRGAYVAVAQLRDRHPSNPAIWAELARRLFVLDRPCEARSALGRAVSFAIDGGSGPLATKLAAEFRDERECIELRADQFARLSRMLERCGDHQAAHWARGRIADAAAKQHAAKAVSLGPPPSSEQRRPSGAEEPPVTHLRLVADPEEAVTERRAA